MGENTGAVFYTAAATAPNGGTLSYQISGGADQALFQITGNGGLSFKVAPDYEQPADADRNNVYQLTLSVSDGTKTSSLSLSVTVTNTDELQVRRVATGLVGTVAIRPAPRANDLTVSSSGLPVRLFVAQENGVVSILTPSTGATKPFLDLRTADLGGKQFAKLPAGGLLDFAATNSFVAGGPTASDPGSWAVSFTTANNNVLVKKGGAPSKAQMDTPVFGGGTPTLWSDFGVSYAAGSSNFSGKMAWDSGGNLRVAFGDGGVAADALPLNTEKGVIIDIHSARWQVYSRGVRNPSGLLYLGSEMLFTDRGSEVEELNLVRPFDLHFGWPYFDGTKRILDGTTPYPFVPPLLEIPHAGTGTTSTHIIAGAVYSGPITALVDQYIFADQDSGAIWSLPRGSMIYGATTPNTAIRKLNTNLIADFGTIDHPTAIGVDADNNLYIADADGEIFLVERVG